MAPRQVLRAAPHGCFFSIIPRAAQECQAEHAAALGAAVGDVCWFYHWPFRMPPGTPPLSSSTGDHTIP